LLSNLLVESHFLEHEELSPRAPLLSNCLRTPPRQQLPILTTESPTPWLVPSSPNAPEAPASVVRQSARVLLIVHTSGAEAEKDLEVIDASSGRILPRPWECTSALRDVGDGDTNTINVGHLSTVHKIPLLLKPP
jgi:hypothetical protein